MSADSISLSTSPNAASSSESVTSIPCGVCRRQFSKYACPKCNLRYCSLSCFRSPAHTECSESFYRKELETDIRITPSKNAEERRQIMELLKRFEDDAQDGEFDLLREDDHDSEDGDDLRRRLASLDLEKVSYDEIWEALTPAERDEFLSAVSDPTGGLARQLLSSEELERQTKAPWWECPKEQAGQVRISSKIHNYGQKPDFVEIPSTAMKAAEATSTDGPSLLYNVCAVFVAYAYITRYLSTSPLGSMPQQESDCEEARKLFSRLVPFLTDRKSKTVLPSLSGLITDLWSRFESGLMTPAFFSLLMCDTAKLIRPAPIISLPSEAPPLSNTAQQYSRQPNADALRVLSDISTLFQNAGSGPKGRAVHPVPAKLAFYAARIMVMPTYILTALAEEILARARLIERESELNSGLPNPEGTKEISAPLNESIAKEAKRPKIEELT